MPLIDALTFTQDADIATGVAADASDYGVGGNPLRSAKANYLLWSKTDKNGNFTLDNPDPGDVLSTLSYAVNTPIDGWYQGILLRFDIYDNGQAYVANDAVYYNGSVYTATTSTTGNLPTDTNFWSAPISNLSTLILNPSVDAFSQSFYIKVRAIQCINDRLTNDCGCGCDGDLYKMRSVLIVVYKLKAADAAFADDDAGEMEKIIRDIELTCETC